MSAEHTPTPWVAGDPLGAADDWQIRNDTVMVSGWAPITAAGKVIAITVMTGYGDIDSRNRAFIVQAVNSHDDLVASLTECRRQVATITEDGTPTDWQAWLADMDAALAKAGAP